MASITVPFASRTAEELQTEVYEYIQEQFPDWTPRAPNLEVAMTEALTNLIFELFTLAADVPDEHLQYFGKLISIERVGARAATVPSTWTTLPEYQAEIKVIPVDTLVGWGTIDDQIVGFTTVNEVTINAGSNTTAAGAITLQAVAEGLDGNGFGGQPELITLLDFVDTITTVGVTDGGRDEENITEYLNRFSTRLQLLADRPIREDDVAIWITTVMSGVGRAIAFDNYNGATDTPDQERCCTWSAHDLDGDDLTAPKIAEITDALDLTREIGFEFYYKAPTRTGIGVRTTVVAEVGVDTVALKANIEDSLRQALHPATWGQPLSAQDPTWRIDNQVRAGWVYAQIIRVEGVRYIDEVQGLQLHTTDSDPIDWYEDVIVLSGLAPLTYLDEDFLEITVIPSPS